MKSLKDDQPTNPTRCVVECVHSGHRSVSFHQCFAKRGFGPKGQYCKRHARRHDDAPSELTLWKRSANFYDVGDALPERVAVREITAKTFIDANGNRCKLKDRYNAYYRTERDALTAAYDNMTRRIANAERSLKLSRIGLERIVKRLTTLKGKR